MRAAKFEDGDAHRKLNHKPPAAPPHALPYTLHFVCLFISSCLQLTNYYSMSICTPARASLMTGRYVVRYGLQYSVIQPGAPWGLPVSEKVCYHHALQALLLDRDSTGV